MLRVPWGGGAGVRCVTYQLWPGKRERSPERSSGCRTWSEAQSCRDSEPVGETTTSCLRVVGGNMREHQPSVSPAVGSAAPCSGLPQVCSDLWKWQRWSYLGDRDEPLLLRSAGWRHGAMLTHLIVCWCSLRSPRGRQDTARGRCSYDQPGGWGGGGTDSY